MPCNQDVEHPTNSSFDLSEFIIDSYFHSIEFGLEVSKGSPRIFYPSLLVDIVSSSVTIDRWSQSVLNIILLKVRMNYKLFS